jgi:hypothetical protein
MNRSGVSGDRGAEQRRFGLGQNDLGIDRLLTNKIQTATMERRMIAAIECESRSLHDGSFSIFKDG